MTTTEVIRPRPEPDKVNDALKEIGGIVSFFSDIRYCLNHMEYWLKELKKEENLTTEQKHSIMRIQGNLIHVRNLLCGYDSGVTSKRFDEGKQ